ncbi:MAG: prepilin peptidase [Elusimicrobiales bacterium]|nr:prepilin peptidase [Elusimicrobiales bacterium]
MIGILFFFGLGLIIGSFLNVCIFRLPNDESIVFPASHCPKCKTNIKWYDNIPVISWLVLGGKCRSCKQPISMQYPIIELLTGVVTMLFYAHWSHYWPWLLIALPAVYTMIVMSVIDFKTMMISDLFSIILVALGILGSPFNPCFQPYAESWAGCLGQSGLGIMTGAGIIWSIAIIGKMIYKKDAVGEGDIILMGAIGALCGWRGVLTSIMIAAFFGTVYGITLILIKKAGRGSAMAFGPFLSLGAAINLYQLVPPTAFMFISPF